MDHATHWEDWSRIHRLAHAKGLRTPATMLYGHIEEPRHRVDHVLRLRELQDETGGFAVFIPLRFQHDFHDSKDGKVRNRLMTQPMATGVEALKTFAVSRLLLDNFDHVKCFWVMHGLSTAQLALNYGADDLDGSVVEYKITHDADNFGTPDKMTREDLLELIRDAGFTPVERNTRYEVIREFEGPEPGAARGAAADDVLSSRCRRRRTLLAAESTCSAVCEVSCCTVGMSAVCRGCVDYLTVRACLPRGTDLGIGRPVPHSPIL